MQLKKNIPLIQTVQKSISKDVTSHINFSSLFEHDFLPTIIFIFINILSLGDIGENTPNTSEHIVG